MKSLKKIGLITAIIGSLTLGGLTINMPKRLENKLPRVSMGTANAMEYKEDGWPVPSREGYVREKKFYADVSDKVLGEETLIEKFVNAQGKVFFKLSIEGKPWAYTMADEAGKDYTIVDSKCRGVFDEKYIGSERFGIPECFIKENQ